MYLNFILSLFFYPSPGVSKLDPEELKKTIVESNSIPVMKPLPELFEKVFYSPIQLIYLLN